MNTSYGQNLMALAEIADRQARQLRILRKFQLLQGVTLLFLGLTQLMQTFAIARGMR